MKALIKYLKPVTYLLSLLILFQGCKIYHSTPVSVEKAINTSKYVKIKDENNTYKFKYLSEGDGKLYGFMHRNSKTAKLLSNQIVDNDLGNGLVKIELKKEQATEIYPINNALSDVVSIVIVPVTLIAILCLAIGINGGVGIY